MKKFFYWAKFAAGAGAAVLLTGCGLFEELAWDLLTQHTPGREYCAKEVKTHQHQYSAWVKVPIDHAHPQLGWTEIYTWTWDPFDPEKPSVLVFEGGPGGGSHSGHLDLPDFNVIYFDQRGVACSQAPTRDLHFDLTYYSSRHTARDAEELRKHYGIQEWTVYGTSYGTVPATIYASLFPESTRAALLEGVVFAGNQDLWGSEYTRRVLQRYFDRLSPERQNFILRMSQRDPLFFSDLILPLMYQDNFDQAFEAQLDQLMGRLEKASGEDFGAPESSASDFQVQSEMSYQTYRALFCRELGGLEAGSSQLVFQGRTLSYDSRRRHQMGRICRGVELGPQRELEIPYRATDYPIQVPVVYFQGARDGATAADAAVRHYKQVPQALRQIFIMPNGGHGPNYFRIAQLVEARSGQRVHDPQMDPEVRRIQQQIFSQVALGLKVDPVLLAQFRQLSPQNPWAYAFNPGSDPNPTTGFQE